MRVNTLVIGAGRSGTTSLCKYMEEHPGICFSVIKELHYFSIEELYQRGLEYYHSFFPEYKGQSIVASADTYLLMDHAAILRIKDYNPDMKIVVLLRQPVDRTYSSYNYSVNYGHHDAYPSFLDSLEHEKQIEQVKNIVDRNNVGHFYGSLYHYHLSKWLDAFPRENVLILTTNQLKNDPTQLHAELCRFLGIEYQGEQQEEKKLNPNAVPKSKLVERFLLDRDHFLRRWIRALFPAFLKRWIIHSNIVDQFHNLNRKESKYLPLSDQEREKAERYFKKDLEKLAKDFDIHF
ncbi:MAG TPA: sulfotransferase domain-containing protein [Sunxiuqinia sp.]|nr:sulfotransferase domain-containing protein [Sunxiuqinia sp.]